MFRLHVSFVVISTFWSLAQCGKILAVFPMPSISHQVVFRPLVHELARRGHEVVVITPDPAFPPGKAPANLTEIDVHDISYPYISQMLRSTEGKTEDFMEQVLGIFEVMPSVFRAQLEVPEVQRILKEEKHTFDLVIVEACARAALGLGHLFKAPMIVVSSFGVAPPHYALAGAPVNLFLYPTPMNLRAHNLTLFEKIRETINTIKIVFHIFNTQHLDYAVARAHFGEDMPSFDVLYTTYVKMLFINEHHLWASNRPVPPNILYIGGIHEIPEKPLPNDIKTYLDSSKHGVIYVSFGTNVKSNKLPTDKIQVMTAVLGALRYDVLWKWDGDTLPGKSDNIRIAKWLPQPDLLKHANVIAFVTQCGLQSTDEAISAAVPLVGLPMLGDQWYNADKYVHHGIGVHLHFPTLTTDAFKHALETVINDTRYKKNIVRLRALMRAEPVDGRARAAWWAEHVLALGGDHLQPPTLGMHGPRGLARYYELPLLLTLCALAAALVSIVYLVLSLLGKIVARFLFRGSKIKAQ